LKISFPAKLLPLCAGLVTVPGGGAEKMSVLFLLTIGAAEKGEAEGGISKVPAPKGSPLPTGADPKTPSGTALKAAVALLDGVTCGAIGPFDIMDTPPFTGAGAPHDEDEDDEPNMLGPESNGDAPLTT